MAAPQLGVPRLVGPGGQQAPLVQRFAVVQHVGVVQGAAVPLRAQPAVVLGTAATPSALTTAPYPARVVTVANNFPSHATAAPGVRYVSMSGRVPVVGPSAGVVRPAGTALAAAMPQPYHDDMAAGRRPQEMNLKDGKALALAVANPQALLHYSKFFFRRFDLDKNGVLTMDELEQLLPVFHFELGLDARPDGKLVRARMKKFDHNGDGVLSEQEFQDLVRWYLWRRYEDHNPPLLRRGDLIGKAHEGVPTKFYDIGEQLGIGSFGVVHRIRHFSTGLQRVMKTVNKAKAVAAGTPIGELKNEIDMLALLDHPAVLRLFEWYNDTENIYIVTDECAGGDLFDLLTMSSERQWALPGPWIVKIFREVLEAISYCHRKGVMHKDLKFENVMLMKAVTPTSPLADVAAVVIDVGLSELFGEQHGRALRCNASAGSLSTMAPEVIQGDFSFKCDIWSIGCILFAMYNTEPFYVPDGAGGEMLYMYPFYPQATNEDHLGLKALLEAQRRGPPLPQVKGGGGQLAQLLQEMLQFNENNRPTARQCLMSAWFALNPEEQMGPEQHFSQEHLNGLQGDRNKRLVWRSTMLQAASMLPASALAPLARQFQSADANHDGLIDVQELCKALVAAGAAPEVAQPAAAAADFDGDGSIEWSEFVAVCLPCARELFAVSLQAAFAALDEDRSGYLDKSELQQLLRSGQIDMPAYKSVEAMLQELDANGDGKVSFSEFHDYYMHTQDA